MSASELDTDGWAPVLEKLSAEFEDHEIKPGAVYARGDKFYALALTYISREHVQERLNAVLGIGNWCTSFKVIEEKEKIVECTLGVRLSNRHDWIYKTDVGGGQGSSEPDEWKGAYSDSFKRAATHIGVGHYLYYLGKKYLPCKAEMKGDKAKFKGWIEDADPVTGEVPQSGKEEKPQAWLEAEEKFESLRCQDCHEPCFPKYTQGNAANPRHLAAWCSNRKCERQKRRGYCYPVSKADRFNKPKATADDEKAEVF